MNDAAQKRDQTLYGPGVRSVAVNATNAAALPIKQLQSRGVGIVPTTPVCVLSNLQAGARQVLRASIVHLHAPLAIVHHGLGTLAMQFGAAYVQAMTPQVELHPTTPYWKSSALRLASGVQQATTLAVSSVPTIV